MKDASKGKGKRRQARKNGQDGGREIEFPQVRGKVIESVKFSSDGLETTITLDFSDRTALIFDCRPEIRSAMSADYSDWATGEARGTRRWGNVSRWNGF